MSIITEEDVYAGEFLISEGNGAISRDSIVIVSGAGVLEAGAVLGKVTASGKYIAYDNAATNGSEVAAAVLFSKVDATSADTDGVAITRSAEVKSDLLVYGSAQNGAAKTAAVADLKAAGIIAR
jgi:hypothetical protein